MVKPLIHALIVNVTRLHFKFKILYKGHWSNKFTKKVLKYKVEIIEQFITNFLICTLSKPMSNVTFW